MKELAVNLKAEKEEILKRYRILLRACRPTMQKGDQQFIRRAFDRALESHQNMRRKSGEPYIYHPIAVAQIAAHEIGLGTTSVVCALLHDVVEDTYITLEDIECEFGKKIAKIIDGLTKISGVFDYDSSLQAENFRKMLLTLADDVRVILIKLADRLHNMRTMDFMPRDKQLKLSSETIYLYAPLAHRLGLYALKSELEDLSMKYTEPDAYQFIITQLTEKKSENEFFIQNFIAPISKNLKKQGLQAEIYGRPKSVYSIWNKMKKKNVPFDKIYDIFAIRIIIKSKSKNEKADCWRAYSIVTDYYRPNPDRLHDWISSSKANGYESLHTTVMGPHGQWVEVQIRTTRMNEIAEKGFAAHWKYKESSSESSLDQWISKIREMLSNPESNALDFLDDFKMNLFSDEIFIFTPKGLLVQLPINATALDFAFEIHTDLGTNCIGAKVNHKLVPLSHKLQSGDQVEIITSSKQIPQESWLSFVATAKAKLKIKLALKEEKRKIAEEGKAILERKLQSLKIIYDTKTLQELVQFFEKSSVQDLLHNIGKGLVDIKQLKTFVALEKTIANKSENPHSENGSTNIKSMDAGIFLIGDDLEKINYKFSTCCHPIPGDDIFGFVVAGHSIKIHRTTCRNTSKLMSSHSCQVVKAKWDSKQKLVFLTGLQMTGIDNPELIHAITQIISKDFNMSIQSMNTNSDKGILEASMMIFVNDTEQLNRLIAKLREIKGITSVLRLDHKIDHA